MKHRQRVKLAEGIYEDRRASDGAVGGRVGTVKVGRQQREQRFPPGTDLDTIERCRIQMRAELDRERPDADDEPAPVDRGTWNAAVARYLPLIAGKVGYKADRSHLAAWQPFLGRLLRHAIKPAHIERGIRTWLAAGKSPKTIRHRVRVVRELYRKLDGLHARPPLKGVKLPKVGVPNPTATPIALIQRVAQSLKNGLTGRQRCGPARTMTTVHYPVPAACHARFLVRATTGQRPCQIMRALPTDVDLVRRIWFVRAAKGGTVIPFPLNADQVRAWRAFIAADAWGPFDARSFSKTIRRHGWPAGIRPYNLRHTFAIDHLLAGTNLGDLQGFMGHRQIETTRKFYGPILLARLKKASAGRKLKLA